ncbi:MAG: dihydropteroate synthase [Fimbriimonadaceae bacterium]|nr:dihydropteroate synthase [Fimbriimonadaceae bacterium]QYK57029.1 MAG: dihydropteroate synthase [Fimbriimonadaceae bacterium]
MYQLPPDRPAIMGILNVTPDSFSDGGNYLSPRDAVCRAETMVEEGAEIIDVGGESTRPGADPVPLDEELRRVVPVVEELSSRGYVVSIDTSKPAVAARCLEAGAKVVNDVTALRNADMVDVCREWGCPAILMHMQGEPRTMQESPSYQDVVTEVGEFLGSRARAVIESGLKEEQIWIDPGFGFGKTYEHNLQLMRGLDWLSKKGYPLVVGLSRKRWIGTATGQEAHHDRLWGTLAAQVLAVAAGARVVRCHDVAPAVHALRLVNEVLAPVKDRQQAHSA